MTHPWRSVVPLSILLALLAACGESETGAESAGEAVRETAIVENPEQPADDTPTASGRIDFTEADLDLYERAFAKEIEIVRAAGERARSAATAQERGAAMQAQWESESIPAAARAAGVSEERYKYVREAVHDLFRTLDFQGKIDGPMEMDMSRASEEMKAKLAKDPFDALTPSAVSALRARMDRLVPQWAEYVRMTAVAG